MMLIKSLMRWSSLALLAFLVVACDSDKDIEPPAALVPFQAKLAVDRAWRATLGGKDRSLRLGLAPAVDGNRVYAAGPTGVVTAFTAASGQTVWKVPTKLGLAGGPGVGAGLVVTGTSDGQVIALDTANGREHWRTRVSGEVLVAPQIAGQVVVIRTVDGRVHALSVTDGHSMWSNEQAVPRLTLRGVSRPLIVGDLMVCGFDNGKVVAYSLLTGDVLWETAVSPPSGKTEIERLVDIDGELAVSGRDLFVVGFQGRMAMIALDSGQIWWSREASSYRGLAVKGDLVYVTGADGKVTAMKRRDGTPVWTQDKLARRGLTAPAVDGDAIVVADFEGYVHWLDAASGELLGRIATDKKKRVTAPLVVADGVVYLQNDAGSLFALRAQPRK
jgi:outer membrane protein assembly factor BamB